MSMIKHEVDRLEFLKEAIETDWLLSRYSEQTARGRIRTIESAIDTIKTQSEKLHTYAMERSSQYYYDGWIPADEKMPDLYTDVLVCCAGTAEKTAYLDRDGDWCLSFVTGRPINDVGDVIAWRPLPEPYRGGQS